MHRRARPFTGRFRSNEEARLEEQASFAEVSRFIADWCEGWAECGLAPCVRARRCRADGAPCFDRLAGIFYELLAEAPHARRLFDIAVEAYEAEAVGGD